MPWQTEARFNEDWVIAPRGSTTIDRVRQVARWSWTVPYTQKAESTASSALVYCSPIRQLLNPAVTTNTQLLSCSVSSCSKIYDTSQSNLAHEQISQSFYPHATPPWFNGQYYRTTRETGTRMPKHPGFCCSRWCRWCKCRSKLLRCAKLQWHHHINIPTFSFYRLIAVRATQPTVSRHLRKVSVYTTVNIERYACHLMSHTSLLELACTDWSVRYGCLRNTTENLGFFFAENLGYFCGTMENIWLDA